MASDARIHYRRCRKKDLWPSVRVIMASFNHFRRLRGKPPHPRRFREAPPLFHHIRSTDPGLVCCAWKADRIIGFGCALLRGTQWYLAWLFVHPRYQQGGIGGKLLEKVWRDGKGFSHSLCTFSSNMQAVGLYSSFGMVPEAMLTIMQRAPGELRLPPPTGLEATRDLRKGDLMWIHSLEKKIRGYPRRPEWEFWRRSEDFEIYLFHRRGRPVGYSMISEWGEVAPAGAISHGALLDVVVETLRIAKGRETVRVHCPNRNKDLYSLLLEAGMRNQEMILFLSDTKYGDLQRYTPASLAVF